MRNASFITSRASARSRTRVAKAASISRGVLALRTEICSPRPRAASGISRNVASAMGGLAGLTSTAMRTALGTRSCSRPSRLAITSATKKLMPVTLPPGRARLVTRPNFTGSSTTQITWGRGGRSFCKRRSSEGRGDHGHAAADEIGDDRRHAIVLAFKPMVLHHHVLALDIAGLVKAFTERSGWARGILGRPAGDKTDDRDRRLLRARRERPGRRRAAEHRYELAPPS